MISISTALEADLMPMATKMEMSEKNLLGNGAVERAFKELYKIAPFLEGKIFLAGGCFTSFANGDFPKDLDFYFKDRETIDLFMERFAIPKPDISTESGYQYSEELQQMKLSQPQGMGRALVALSRNSIKIHHLYDYAPPISLNILHSGQPEEITGIFDFVHCQAYYSPEDGFHLTEETKSCISNKILKVNNECESIEMMVTIHRAFAKVRDGWSLSMKDQYMLAALIKKAPANTIYGPLMDNKFPSPHS